MFSGAYLQVKMAELFSKSIHKHLSYTTEYMGMTRGIREGGVVDKFWEFENVTNSELNKGTFAINYGLPTFDEIKYLFTNINEDEFYRYNIYFYI